jgi:hypothetical protein
MDSTDSSDIDSIKLRNWTLDIESKTFTVEVSKGLSSMCGGEASVSVQDKSSSIVLPRSIGVLKELRNDSMICEPGIIGRMYFLAAIS